MPSKIVVTGPKKLKTDVLAHYLTRRLTTANRSCTCVSICVTKIFGQCRDTVAHVKILFLSALIALQNWLLCATPCGHMLDVSKIWWRWGPAPLDMGRAWTCWNTSLPRMCYNIEFGRCRSNRTWAYVGVPQNLGRPLSWNWVWLTPLEIRRSLYVLPSRIWLF